MARRQHLSIDFHISRSAELIIMLALYKLYNYRYVDVLRKTTLKIMSVQMNSHLTGLTIDLPFHTNASFVLSSLRGSNNWTQFTHLSKSPWLH